MLLDGIFFHQALVVLYKGKDYTPPLDFSLFLSKNKIPRQYFSQKRKEKESSTTNT
jgi:hypothetical protein